MKLIIDIPEKVVTAIQNGEDYRYDIHTTIAQGIPYESKGDLISRNAVIRMFNTMDRYKADKLILQDTDKEFPGNEVFIVDDCYELLDLIDNAPTVEYPFYQEAYQTGYEEGKNAKQQGEWVDYSEEGFVECPFCHKATNCEDNIDELHFCWNCGAKLGKGGAE